MGDLGREGGRGVGSILFVCLLVATWGFDIIVVVVDGVGKVVWWCLAACVFFFFSLGIE